MTPENMQEYTKMMEGFMDSPMMQEFLNDPEKMEQCVLVGAASLSQLA